MPAIQGHPFNMTYKCHDETVILVTRSARKRTKAIFQVRGEVLMYDISVSVMLNLASFTDYK